MSSDVLYWLTNVEKHYFERQVNLLLEANNLPSQRKARNGFSYSLKRHNHSNTQVTNSNASKKRRNLRDKNYGFDVPIDQKLQFSFTQLNRLERRQEEENYKNKKEVVAAKISQVNKKPKGLIDWSEDIEEILSSYKRSFTYLNSRVARTDKRELLRIAQEVQASHRIRRTCFPILKLPPSLTMTLPSRTVGRQSITSFHRKREYKKPEEVRVTTSAENTRTLPTKNLTQDGHTQKRRKIFTNTGKEIKREYLKVKTVNLNLEELPTSDLIKKPVLPNLHKSIQPTETTNKLKINSKNAVRNQNTISKILVNEDEYRMTINEDGRFEDINVSLQPMMNSIQNYYTENYFQLQPKINDDVEKLIVVTTASGTTFEMKQPKTALPNNFYEKSQTIKKLFPIATRKK